MANGVKALSMNCRAALSVGWSSAAASAHGARQSRARPPTPSLASSGSFASAAHDRSNAVNEAAWLPSLQPGKSENETRVSSRCGGGGAFGAHALNSENNNRPAAVAASRRNRRSAMRRRSRDQRPIGIARPERPRERPAIDMLFDGVAFGVLFGDELDRDQGRRALDGALHDFGGFDADQRARQLGPATGLDCADEAVEHIGRKQRLERGHIGGRERIDHDLERAARAFEKRTL